MIKGSQRYLQGLQPELHRYAQSTFHEGTHRQAPGDSTPWKDVSSPISRLRAWWLAPAAKGSFLSAWCLAIVISIYCVVLQQDAKRTYILNSTLLRNLHEETLRADANQERVNHFSRVIKNLYKLGKIKNDTFKEVHGCEASAFSQVVDYETELCREQARAELLQERNDSLVQELYNERQLSLKLQRENNLFKKNLKER